MRVSFRERWNMPLLRIRRDSGGMRVKRILALFVAVGAALAICSTSLADALGSGHGAATQQGGNLGQFKPPSGTAGAHTSGVGTLPFTGLNLALVAAVAVLLLASGLVLHRMTRRQQ